MENHIWIIPMFFIIVGFVWMSFDRIKYARKLKDYNKSLYKPYRSYENN